MHRLPFTIAVSDAAIYLSLDHLPSTHHLRAAVCVCRPGAPTLAVAGVLSTSKGGLYIHVDLKRPTSIGDSGERAAAPLSCRAAGPCAMSAYQLLRQLSLCYSLPLTLGVKRQRRLPPLLALAPPLDSHSNPCAVFWLAHLPAPVQPSPTTLCWEPQLAASPLPSPCSKQSLWAPT